MVFFISLLFLLGLLSQMLIRWTFNSGRNVSVVYRPCPCRRRHRRNLFSFSLSSQEALGQFQTNLATKHPCAMEIQICSNEGSNPFLMGYNIAKI